MSKERIRIRDLYGKLDALAAALGYAKRTGLAKAWKVNRKTINWWHVPSAGRGPDEVPPEFFKKLSSELSALCPDLPLATIERLLKGPTQSLKDALEAAKAPGLMRIIRRDAVQDEATLIRRADELALVELETTEPFVAAATIRLDELFRIEYVARVELPFAIVLQHSGHAWGAIAATRREDTRRWLAPGLNIDQTPLFMRERRSPGEHRFICLQSTDPVPASILAYARDPIGLDKHALETLADWYELPDARRRCQLLDVLVEG